VDTIVEVAFDQNIQADADMLTVGGSIATYSAGPVPQPPIPFFTLMRKSHTVHYVLVYTMGEHAHQVGIRDVTACLEAGQFRTQVGARFPLERAAEAHEAQDSGAVVGKILVDIARAGMGG
jgi:NADPH2:quinone reductase